MAINNNTNNKIEEDNIIFAVQGAKSFLKCKMDWVCIGKLHVSFVSHTGLESGCKQLGHIEAALPFDGEDGALALGKMILRGDLDKGRARSIKKAKETGAKYPEPVFTYNGGSEAKADRPVMWRQVSIAPGAKSDFVFQVTEAEGEKNVRGGYQKKVGAEVKRISVGVNSRKLLEYASKIEAYYQDYLANPERYAGYWEKNAQVPAPAATSALPTQVPVAVTAPAPVPAPAPVAVVYPDFGYTVYDSACSGMEMTYLPEKALEALQRKIKEMKTSGWSRRDNTDYDKAKNNILAGSRGFFVVNLYKGDESMQIYVNTCPTIQ